MKSKAQRELEHDVQARTIKTGNDLEPRISREDEDEIVRQVRAKEDQARRERNELIERAYSDGQHALDQMRHAIGRVTGRDYRDLDSARRLLLKLRDRNVSS